MLGAALYAAPLLVWLRFSRDVVSPAGLAGFVEAAAGRPLALVQAAIWAFSYFLYLPYTVTDIVYEMLVVVFPGIEPGGRYSRSCCRSRSSRWCCSARSRRSACSRSRRCCSSESSSSSAPSIIHHVGAPTGSFTHAHGLRPGAANIALALRLRQPAALPRREVAGGGRTIRRALPIAGVIAAAYVVFAVFAFAAVDPAVRASRLPGYAIAGAYSGRTLAIVVGVGAAASVAGLIVAEYLALSRLLFAFTGVPFSASSA